MSDTVTIDLRHVVRGLSVPLRQVEAVVELLDEGNTVPFITRYRKDQTGGLDEEQIREIQDRLAKARLLADRKQTVLRSIEAQGKLSETLAKQIRSASTAKRLEDLYLPHKPKKQTLATLARTRGLEGLAEEILQAAPLAMDLDRRAADFANPDKEVPTPADALLGAGHILAEQFSEQPELRQRLRDILQRTGRIITVGTVERPEPVPEKPAKPRKTVPAEQAASAALPSGEESPEAAGESPAPEPGPVEIVAAEVAAETPAVMESPATLESPPSEPVAEPLPETPVAETPVAETPVAEASVAEPSAVALPGGEAPLAEAAPTAELVIPTEATVVQSVQPVEQPAAEAVSEETPSQGTEASEPQGAEPPAPAPGPAKAPRPQPAPKSARATKAEQRKQAKEAARKKKEEKRLAAFADYFDYTEELKRVPPHRVLAINRGERSKMLRVKIEADMEAMAAAVEEMLVPPDHPHGDFLRGCARDALTRLIFPSLDREIRRELTDRAELHAVQVFAKNLRNLLLQPPVRGRRVLAMDPGYKSGCKLVALDQFGNVLDHAVIFLVGKKDRRQASKEKVVELVGRFGLQVVAIGNGTGGREAEDFVAELLSAELKDGDVSYVIVNEAGASVYSTSHAGRDEFPHYDAMLRGAISIGRRLQDPLSELVKIEPANIGVGLYQHDVKAKHLQTSLDDVVESCVNYVGVDVNTASPALLRYVSGLNQLTARRVYEQRRNFGPFRNREQLKQVPGFGEATFVQAAGFLKIPDGDQPLDATWIHPESYPVALRLLEKLGALPGDLATKEGTARLAEKASQIDLDAVAQELGVGSLTLKDILSQFARPGRDPREDFPPPLFRHGVLKLEDLTPGMELTGTVLNVVDFGAFVDIGMHHSGLVHVSHMADRFVRDPHEVVAVGDIVKVWVIEVDKQRRRVSLTMIAPGTERPPQPRHGRPEYKPASPPSQEGGSPAAAEAPPQRPPRPEGGRPPRRDRPPRGGGGGGRREQARPAPTYTPKPRPPKPIVPITDEMKTGKKPMRSFSDLFQFYEQKDTPESPESEPDKKEGKKRKKGDTPSKES